MSDVFMFLFAPFVMALILVGIHCYLGLHVLARGVIFVDLALAQVAALGSVVAYLLGYDHHDPFTYFLSLSLTILAAAFLAISNRHRIRLSQEAIIGVLYAFGSASVILMLDQASHGSEHLKYALVGQLLWVSWFDVAKVFGIYSMVAIAHYLFRGPLIEASFGDKPKIIWDFVFYALFGIVITSSVHVAGVLLVFAFLIVPALISSLFFTKLIQRLIFGWLLGSFLCALGLLLSYQLDVPAGALIVVIFSLIPLGTVAFLRRR